MFSKHGLDVQCIAIQEGHQVSLSNPDWLPGFTLVPGPVLNSVCTFLQNGFAGSVNVRAVSQRYQVISIYLHGFHIVLLNIHIWDSGSMSRNGLTMKSFLAPIQTVLDELWVSDAWQLMLMVGDFNVQVPAGGPFGPSASGHWSQRLEDLLEFTNKYHLEWTSTFDIVDPTHVHKSSKTRRSLDYILMAKAAGISIGAKCRLCPEASISSDHLPLLLDFTLPTKSRRSKQPSVRRLPRMSGKTANRFGSLMEERASSGGALGFEALGRLIVDCHEQAVRDVPPDKPQEADLAEMLRAPKVSMASATSGAEVHAALQEVTKQKRAFLKKRAEARFIRASLGAPREDKAKHNTSVIHPLEVDGVPTSDPELWKQEFKKALTRLFWDASNNLEVQTARLTRLQELARDEPRLAVPLFLLEEGISRARRKSGSTPGRDRVTWNAIACLPASVKRLLCEMFEARLNNDPGWADKVDTWASVIVRFIPKVSSPRKFRDWRPISLVCTLQKLYLFIVMRLMDSTSTETSDCHYGFRSGHQPAEIHELVRSALIKCKAYGLDCTVVKLDIDRAFDSIDHEKLTEALLASSCPARIVRAILLELHDCAIDVLFQGESWTGFPFTRGGRQGSSDTPGCWNRVFDQAVSRARLRWRAEGLGVALPDDADSCSFFDRDMLAEPPPREFSATPVPRASADLVLDIATWADDALVFAQGKTQAVRMIQILHQECQRSGLSFKLSSLEYMNIWDDSPPFVDHWSMLHGPPLDFRSVDKMNVLGLCFMRVFSYEQMAQHRVSQGWLHWSARKHVLCDKRIPLKKRVDRFLQCVGRTLLYGAGIWATSDAARSKVSGTVLEMVRFMLCRHPREGETQGQFIHRLNGTVKWLWDTWLIPSFESQILRTHLGWMGHVARLPATSMVYRVFFWRSTAWRDAQDIAVRRTKYRFHNVGRPVKAADAEVSFRVGPLWPMLARHRENWARAVVDALVPLLPADAVAPPLLARMGLRVPLLAPTLCPLDFGFLDHLSNKHAETFLETRMVGMVPVHFFANLPHEIGVLNGTSVPQPASEIYVRHARWMIYLLSHRWNCRPLSTDQAHLWVACPPRLCWFPEFCCRWEGPARDLACWRDCLIDVAVSAGFVVTLHVEGGSSPRAAVCIQQVTVGGQYLLVGWVRQDLPAGRQHRFEAILFACRVWVATVIRLRLAVRRFGGPVPNGTLSMLLGICNEL